MTYSRSLPHTLSLALLLSIGLPGCIPKTAARPSTAPAPEAPPTESRIGEAGKTAGTIVTQPARDVGASKIKIPPVLLAAHAYPYAPVNGLSCDQIGAEVAQLDEALGPDYVPDPEPDKENKAGKLAEAGGKTVVNAIIPFRGLVREITGAAPAQRRLNDAVDAGYARRGFLRATQLSMRCPVTMAVRPAP